MESVDREPVDSVGHRMCFVLYHWPTESIRREALRAFMPAGATRRAPDTTIAKRRMGRSDPTKSQNLVTRKFKTKLPEWETEGRLRRCGELVEIVNRQAFSLGANSLPAPVADHILRQLDA